jgi:protein-S-isoprenylcysteine O-methyltransferase Ste14
MDPLAVHDPVAEAILRSALGAWILFELVLRLRNRTPSNVRDPTFIVVVATTGGAIGLGFRFARIESTVIGGGWAVFIAGVVVLVAGFLFRAWAILTLGRFFTPTVQVQSGQRVIESGPYRYLRHPSYTGMLVGLLGLGIAFDNWLSLLVLALLPLVGLVVRIYYEESVLREVLGDDYRDYASRTRRLVPGVW